MKHKKSILLVEDDKVDVMTVKRAFKHLEIDNPLNTVGDGEEALNWLEANREDLPCLILLDLNMPKMNGIEFLQVAKKDPLFKMIPVVVLTTSEDQQDRVNSFQLSIAGYMVKSHSYPEFLKVISSISDYWENSEIAY
jgi:CheY-like chemotaxis protein